MKGLQFQLFYLIIFCEAHMLNIDAFDVEFLPDYYKLCPYNNFCKSPQQKEIVNDSLVSCCETCDCDADCYEIGNCCPDSEFVQAGKFKYPCINLEPDINGNNYFHVINDCKNSSLTDLHPRCLVSEELEDLVLVSDQATGRVYKNRHCATCHGVQDFQTWDINIECDEIFQISFQSLEQRNRYIYQNRDKCKIYSEPPKNRMIELSRCSPEHRIWDTCNISNSWDHYDEKTAEACHQYNNNHQTLFRHFYDGRNIVFANVFCFLCNVPKVFNMAHLCKPIGDETYRTSFIKQFTALIDLQTEEEDSTTHVCARYEIWDPYSELCRSILCPVGTVPNYGDCKSILKFSVGAPIQVRFTVTVVDGMDTVEYGVLLDFLEEKILQKFGNGCEAYGSEIRKIGNSDLVLLKVDLSSTKTCSVHDVLSKLHSIAIEGKGIQLIFRTKFMKIRVILGLVQSGYDSNMISVPLAHKNKKTFEISYILISPSIFSYCTQVQLTLSEIKSLKLNTFTTQVNAVTNSEGDERVQYVCVETYFKTRRLLLISSSGVSHTLKTVFCFLSPFVSYFCSMLSYD